MAKRPPIFPNREVTVTVNDGVIGYLEDLARTGLYGNTHDEVATIVLRVGLKHLIDAGALKPKEFGFSQEEKDK
jgi:hypothetical protein